MALHLENDDKHPTSDQALNNLVKCSINIDILEYQSCKNHVNRVDSEGSRCEIILDQTEVVEFMGKPSPEDIQIRRINVNTDDPCCYVRRDMFKSIPRATPQNRQ